MAFLDSAGQVHFQPSDRVVLLDIIAQLGLLVSDEKEGEAAKAYASTNGRGAESPQKATSSIVKNKKKAAKRPKTLAAKERN